MHMPCETNAHAKHKPLILASKAPIPKPNEAGEENTIRLGFSLKNNHKMCTKNTNL